jgi:hypothetical protein
MGSEIERVDHFFSGIVGLGLLEVVTYGLGNFPGGVLTNRPREFVHDSVDVRQGLMSSLDLNVDDAVCIGSHHEAEAKSIINRW